jgi:hypothetical protein
VKLNVLLRQLPNFIARPGIREPVPPGAMRIPGGKPMAIVLASVGLITTALTIVLAIVPPNDEPNKGIAIAKVIGSTFVLSSRLSRHFSTFEVEENINMSSRLDRNRVSAMHQW